MQKIPLFVKIVTEHLLSTSICLAMGRTNSLKKPFLTVKDFKFIVLQIVYRDFTQDIYVITVLLKQNDEK